MLNKINKQISLAKSNMSGALQHRRTTDIRKHSFNEMKENAKRYTRIFEFKPQIDAERKDHETGTV